MQSQADEARLTAKKGAHLFPKLHKCLLAPGGDHKAVYQGHRPGTGSGGTLQRRASLANDGDREAILAHPDAIDVSPAQLASGSVYVATERQVIVGFAAILLRDDGNVELDALFVEPSRWRQRIGRRLIEHCEAAARSLRSDAVCVVGNPHAAGFYLRCGYERIGTIGTRFGEGMLFRKVIR